MDLRQLQAFLAVIEHGGFTAAAKATHTVQSNISTHVSRLEQELNTTLIDRSTGEPTDAGQAVMVRAKRVTSELNSLASDVASLEDSPRGVVRFGMIGTTARWVTPLLIEELAKSAPEVSLIVADGSSEKVAAELLSGHIDLGLLGLPTSDSEIVSRPLFQEDHIVVVPNDHPLAKQINVTKAQLARTPLLLTSAGGTFRSELESVFAADGLSLTPQLEVDGLKLLASLAFQGLGPAIVPATAASDQRGNWKRASTQDIGGRTVGLATRRKGIPSVAAQATLVAAERVIRARAGDVEGIHIVN